MHLRALYLLNFMNEGLIGIMQWQAVFFDFDGVILDSVNVKTHAFSQMFRKYGPEIEESVVRYHLENARSIQEN